MASWDLTEVVSGQIVKSAHVRNASNSWQGDVAANNNNLFAVASVEIQENTPPSSPASGKLVLYVDSSDHFLKYKTSAGIVTSFASLTLPSQGGNSGKYLTTDGTSASWGTVSGALPTQTSNSGKFLTTDGTTASWIVISQIPTQTSNSGKYLTTDGTTASWNVISQVPTQTSNSGKFLTTDGTTASWNGISQVPSQTSNSGKFLTTDGTTASWGTVSGSIPSQTGNSGKFLTTDGTTASWTTLSGGGDVLGASNLTTVGAIAIVASSGHLTQDQTSTEQLFWDLTNHRLGIGTASPSAKVHITGASGEANLISINSDFTTPTINLQGDKSTSSGGGAVVFKTSKGTAASPTTMVSGDLLGSSLYQGHDGTDYATVAGMIRCYVDNTVSTDVVPGRISFFTAPVSGADGITEVMRINAHGRLLVGTTTDDGTNLVQVNGSVAATSLIGAYDAEASGNTLTVPFIIGYVAAKVQGGVAIPSFTTPASGAPTATAVIGTNTIYGTLSFADSGIQSVQDRFHLPSDWTGNIDVQITWRSSATSGDVIWNVQTTGVTDGATGDPAWNTANTVTDTTKGTANQFNTCTISSITTSGLTAGGEMFFKILRDPTAGGDTLGAAAELIGITFKLRRAI